MGACQSCFNRTEDKFEIREFCFSLCCCFSINDDKSQSGEPNERTTLLGNPVSNSHNYNRPLFGGDIYRSEVPGNRGDEQSALSRILQQTECDVINVAAIPTHLERKEYLDRVKIYEQKLQNVQSQYVSIENQLILKDLPHPEKILSESPLTLADLKMVGDFFTDVHRSLQDVRVQPHMDLVAQFGSS